MWPGFIWFRTPTKYDGPSNSIGSGELLSQLKDYYLLKKDSAPCNYGEDCLVN
jgi:hypothetical protein